MNRRTLAAILGLSGILASPSSYGQGKIHLDNYNASGYQVVYGSGPSAVPGTVAGSGLRNGPNGTAGDITWNIGFYYALGDVTASVSADPSGVDIPSGGGLTLASGALGDTTTIRTGVIPVGGYFVAVADGIINGWTAGSITMEIVAYSGADYASSLYRGHSAAFLMTPLAVDDPKGAPRTSSLGGVGMPAFSVFSVPEPSTFVLAGLGAVALLALRRSK